MVKCLSLTIILELLIALLLGIREKKDILNVILVNIITNPLVVSISTLFLINGGIKAHDISEYILEVLAVISEGFIYNKYLKYKKINGYLLSFILNLLSYSIGYIIMNLI